MLNIKTAVLVASTTICCSGAIAQTTAEAQHQMPMQNPQTEVALTDANLLKFSVAMDSIQKIGDKYEGKFQNAEDQQQAQQVQQKAQTEMLDAVKAAGLTPEQYNSIAHQAQQDEELRSKILAMSNSKQHKKDY